MRLFAFLGFSVVASAAITPQNILNQDKVIEREAGRGYTVKLECIGCPVRACTGPEKAAWLQPSPNSSLLLKIDMTESNDALLLNGNRIFPLDPMPLHINAVQIPTTMQQDEADSEVRDTLDPNKHRKIMLPLQYKHTVFRADESNHLWVQFNVTGLPWRQLPEPIKMGQKIVQILLRKEYDQGLAYDKKLGSPYILSILDVQLVEAKDKVQPPRMKCGKLAMVQTTFDPSEWDDHGKIGTWSRTWSIFVGKLQLGGNTLLFPLLALVAASLVMARRLFLQRQKDKIGTDLEAETALLGCDAPPPYADIPVIKIEEYD
ncbi:hypothetical protein ACET3X_008954 [Alternaria dauci]|uniref:DUF7728 domain-containing protein n=1 Tax=Alternaria dauci TaxID=48095 RepID=A0ABR3U8D6_9PLEO